MSFDQTPPPAAPAPPVVGAPPPAAVYRQDEFVRQPTSWTRPMQMGVAAYFVLSTVINLASQLFFREQFKTLAAAQVARQFQASGRALTDAGLRQAVDLGLGFALVFGVIIGLLVVGLAVLTATKPRAWVFWIDFVLLALGVLGLLSSLSAVTNPSAATIPAGAAAISLVTGLADAALVVWMLIGLVKYGPWALEKVPAAL